MGYTVFSVAGLAQVVRAGDSRRFNVDLKNDRGAIIAAASTNALAGSVSLSEFHTTKLRGKPCVSYREYERALVLRSVSRHLKRRLKISMPNRDQIVKGVITSLLDATPMSVIRCDIESFYESVPIEGIRDRLLYDTASSSVVRSYYKDFFASHCTGRSCGLPRGAGLSAVLAEIAIRPFDEAVRAIPEIYRYFRYADDIVAFVTGNPSSVLSRMRTMLPTGMKFNGSKTHICDLSAGPYTANESPREPKIIDYLGYQISIEDESGKGRSRHVDVSISPKKICRLKSKVIMAFRDYKASHDYGLLIERITFISSNYKIKRTGHSYVQASDFIKSGIYYNYALCGRYRVNDSYVLSRSQPSLNALKALDGMLRSLIRSRNSEFRHSVNTWMPSASRSRLIALSFAQGYHLKMLMRVTPERVTVIKRAWRNV